MSRHALWGLRLTRGDHLASLCGGSPPSAMHLLEGGREFSRNPSGAAPAILSALHSPSHSNETWTKNPGRFDSSSRSSSQPYIRENEHARFLFRRSLIHLDIVLFTHWTLCYN